LSRAGPASPRSPTHIPGVQQKGRYVEAVAGGEEARGNTLKVVALTTPPRVPQRLDPLNTLAAG